MRRTVVALIHNRLDFDSRVIREARSTGQLGDRVVVCTAVGARPPRREDGDGFEVVRVGYRPVDRRVWDNRVRISRPWRFRGVFAAWLVDRARGGIQERGRAALGLVGAIAAVPWVTLTLAYFFGTRWVDRALRLIGRPPASKALGDWLETRGERLVFAFHRPLRVRDWGRRVVAAVDAGVVPRADIWHANDLETVPVALALRRRFGGRVVFDSHELFLDAASRTRLNRLWRALLRIAESTWIQQVDAVVTVNEHVAAELARRYRVEPVVVRNCPPLWLPPPGFTSPLRDAIQEVGLDASRPIVIAHGGFYLDRGFEQLLEAVLPLVSVNLVFLGYGPREAAYRTIAARHPWRGRFAVLPAVQSDDVPCWVAGADVAACLIQPTTLNHRLSTPNKLFEAVTAGVPILGADLPGIRSVVERFDLGRLVDPRDPDAIRRGLSEMLAMPPAARAAIAARARDAAMTELNWEHEFTALATLYDRLYPRPR